ncbi:MAG: T9SS type A sorting domain-containing protein [Bacteroidota bacterium]
MKKNYISLFLAFAAMSAANAQEDMNFEPTGVGAGYTWNVFENDTNPALEFVTNPNPTGANPSGTVAKYTTLITGQPYAGCETNHENGMADFVLDADHAIIKIMVYKSVISDVGIKLVTPSSAALPEMKIANTQINKWEELTFDFTSQIGFFTEPFDQIVVFPDFTNGPRTYGTVVYFDNISFGESEPPVGPTEPMTPAPDPTLPQSQVISMFSGVYTNVPVDTWHTDWSSAGLQDIQIQGNDTKKYTGLNYVGAETVANQIDATDMTHFNIDVWSPNFTQFRIKLVDFGANGVYDGVGVADDKEHELTFETPVQSQWISYHIPLGNFTNLATRANLAQYIFSTSNAGTVFIDNVYFSNETAAGTQQFTKGSVALYPNPAHDVLNLNAQQTIEKVTVHNMLGQQVLATAPHANAAAINVAQLQNGMYVVNTISGGVATSQKFVKQ